MTNWSHLMMNSYLKLEWLRVDWVTPVSWDSLINPSNHVQLPDTAFSSVLGHSVLTRAGLEHFLTLRRLKSSGGKLAHKIAASGSKCLNKHLLCPGTVPKLSITVEHPSSSPTFMERQAWPRVVTAPCHPGWLQGREAVSREVGKHW